MHYVYYEKCILYKLQLKEVHCSVAMRECCSVRVSLQEMICFAPDIPLCTSACSSFVPFFLPPKPNIQKKIIFQVKYLKVFALLRQFRSTHISLCSNCLLLPPKILTMLIFPAEIFEKVYFQLKYLKQLYFQLKYLNNIDN